MPAETGYHQPILIARRHAEREGRRPRKARRP